MRGTLKIDYVKGNIIMSREFAKYAMDTTTPEYRHLQEVKGSNPHFGVIRKTIKKNEGKESYKGLTYEYMINYIASHEPIETKAEVLAEFAELKLISECHAKGKRYPVIKNWFLDKYPAVKEFGIPEAKMEAKVEASTAELAPVPLQVEPSKVA